MSEKSVAKPQKKEVLQFNVAQLLKQTIDAERTYTVTNAVLENLIPDLTIASPITGIIHLVKAGSDILVTGKLKTTLQMACSRCLTPVETPITIDIEETFVPSIDITTGTKVRHREENAEDIDPATLISENHILDLAEVVRQDIYLNQPSQILCKPDCRGLCPQCGQNKNIGTCACKDTHIDARWADLLAKKDNLR